MKRFWQCLLPGLLCVAPAWAEEPLARDLSRFKEQPIEGGSLLLAAYLIMWLFLGMFVLRLVLRQSRMERDLTIVQARMDAQSDAATREAP